MRILILGDASNPHIIKWVNALNSSGIEIIIFSFRKGDSSSFTKGIEIVSFDSLQKITFLTNAALPKVLYLKVIPRIRSIIKEKKPDIVHAHYASSYGFLGALLNFHPFVISVWGSDVIDFPKTSLLHMLLFKFNLYKADRVLSTSKFMAGLLKQYTKKQILVTPFGIDINVFKPTPKPELYFEKDQIIVGCIKGLEWYYGIEYLIEAFRIVIDRLPEEKIRLLIVGGGAIETKIRNLIKELKLEDTVVLTGKINYQEIQKLHNEIDIFVAVSVYEESFGVAVLEASACGKPVIISRVGGMIEVVNDGVTGFIVPPRNSQQTADKILELILDPLLRQRLGSAGRKYVEDFFDLRMCLNNMISVYDDLLINTANHLASKKNSRDK